MGEQRRGADGRRLFDAEFKRQQASRIARGDATVAEVARELDANPSVIRRWLKLYEHGAAAAVKANEDVVPARQLREAEVRIRELERALGRKTMEVEILRAAQQEVKKRPSWYGVSGK